MSMDETLQNALFNKIPETTEPKYQENILMSMIFYDKVFSQELRLTLEKVVKDVINLYMDQKNEVNERLLQKLPITESSIKISLLNGSFTKQETTNEQSSLVALGCVHVYRDMLIDKIGIPMVNNDPRKTTWYEKITFERHHDHCISKFDTINDVNLLDEKSFSVLGCCFNCGSSDHEVSNCPKPKNVEEINKRRKMFLDQTSKISSSELKVRYHDCKVIGSFSDLVPGVISSELRNAMGLDDDEIPEYIYRMRQIGYPPGYLNDREDDSELAVFDHLGENMLDKIEYDLEDGEVKSTLPRPLKRNRSYRDLLDNPNSRVIIYEGFNGPMPKDFPDRGPFYGYPRISTALFPRKIRKVVISDGYDSMQKNAPDVIVLEEEKHVEKNRNLDDDDDDDPSNSATTDVFTIKLDSKWFANPLSESIVCPRKAWRRPPMLSQTIKLNNLNEGCVVKLENEAMLFGDQQLPTGRLDKISKLIKKYAEARNKNPTYYSKTRGIFQNRANNKSIGEGTYKVDSLHSNVKETSYVNENGHLGNNFHVDDEK